MVRSTKESPIDILLKKNSKISELTTESAQGSRIDVKINKRSKRSTKRSADDNGEKTYIKPKDPEDEGENGTRSDDPYEKQRNEDLQKKEKLLKRLRSLGLVPHKYANKVSTSSSLLNKRKCQTPRKACPEDEAVFVKPIIFKCDYCPNTYYHYHFLRQHLIKHLKCQRCKYCNKPYECLTSLRRHQARCKSRKF